MSESRNGVCQLTGQSGKLVKCHIIPEALTKHEEPGQPIFQAGERRRPIKRMTSWYDPRLVTLEGETILARYDDWAIRFLRENKLVWSGWDGPSLRIKGTVRFGDGWQGRRIESDEWARLRLFLLSILWRAAASDMLEFSQVVLPREDLERLRKMVVSGEPAPFEFFPATLIQLITKGPRHNHTPIAGVKSLGPQGPILNREIRFFRFFMEGLIIHFDRDAKGLSDLASLGAMAVGENKTAVILGHPFEGSFQATNLGVALIEIWEDWPRFRPQLVRAVQPMKDAKLR